MKKALLINDNDNVAVSISSLEKDDEVEYIDQKGKSHKLLSADKIPQYHKIAIKPIKKNEFVIKYGEHIGLAKNDIEIGDYVHTHNLKDHREDLKED